MLGHCKVFDIDDGLNEEKQVSKQLVEFLNWAASTSSAAQPVSGTCDALANRLRRLLLFSALPPWLLAHGRNLGAVWNARGTSEWATLELRSRARSSTMSAAERNGETERNLLLARLSASIVPGPLPNRSFPRCKAWACSPDRGPMDNPSVPP